MNYTAVYSTFLKKRIAILEQALNVEHHLRIAKTNQLKQQILQMQQMKPITTPSTTTTVASPQPSEPMSIDPIPDSASQKISSPSPQGPLSLYQEAAQQLLQQPPHQFQESQIPARASPQLQQQYSSPQISPHLQPPSPQPTSQQQQDTSPQAQEATPSPLLQPPHSQLPPHPEHAPVSPSIPPKEPSPAPTPEHTQAPAVSATPGMLLLAVSVHSDSHFPFNIRK